MEGKELVTTYKLTERQVGTLRRVLEGVTERGYVTQADIGKLTGVLKRFIFRMERAAHTKGMELGYEKFAENMLENVAQIQYMAFERVMEACRIVDPETGEWHYDSSLADPKDLDRALALSDKMVDRVKGKATQRIETKHAGLFLHKLADMGELGG